MPDDMIIREALPTDISHLSKSVKDLVEHTRLTSRDTYFLDLVQGYEHGFDSWVSDLIQETTTLVLIAEIDNIPAGSIIAKETAPFLPFSTVKRVGEIIMCWVEPDVRKKGVAGTLVLAVEKWCRERGLEHIELNFIVGNTEAEAVWERLGYKPFRITSRKTLGTP